MEEPMTILHTPEPGFYFHYKHNPEGDWNNYAYQVIGTGHHTEEERSPDDEFMVVYRPLYEGAHVYKLGKLFDLRPLAMFMEPVEKPEYQGPRFTHINDPSLIAQLQEQALRMYGW
jgi:hypothetical protein